MTTEPSPAMRFTVLIVTYNRADLIERSLDSIARQTLPPAEIIVVDDASTDNTAEVVARWAGRMRSRSTISWPNGMAAKASSATSG
jgi:glycosyltransferase involved in cell wall biosynthesis